MWIRCGARHSLQYDEPRPAITDFYRDSLKVIGKGKWSYVKEYSSKSGPNKYAVKMRLKHKMPVVEDGTYTEKENWEFHEEEKILKKLRGHPNVVFFITSFTEQARHFQVFKLLYGGDLYPSIIDKYGESHCEKDVVGYMRDILNGLRYCHEKKIMHRNVIPPNLFLATSPYGDSVKLVGFSLAAEAKYGDKWYGFVSMAGYRAPEITWKGAYSFPIDIFACGCILYNLLTGSHPFIVHTYENPSFYSSAWKLISEPARDLVIEMLNRKDQRRISAAQALNHPFFRDDGQVRVNFPLTTTVDGLKKFTKHNMWEKVASVTYTPCLF